MSGLPQQYVRHPLGLPPGSVRAMLAVMITGLFVLLVCLPAEKVVEVPLFLYFLMSLLLVFITAHGKTISAEGDPHPFGMPKGFFRTLVLIGIVAAIGWRIWIDPSQLTKRLTPTEHQLADWPYLCGSLFGGFLLGRLLRIGPWRSRPMFQDLLAWVSLLCMIGLVIYTLAVVFVRPTMAEGLDLRWLESALTGAIALYFGARS